MMPGINPSATSSSPSITSTASLSLGVKDFTILQPGEIASAEVIRSGPDRKVLVHLKNYRLWADTDVPLKAGDRLMLRVEQLHPKVVLRLWENASGQSRIDECLRFYRSDPNALLKLIGMAAPLMDDGRFPAALRNTITSILQVIDSLILSEKTVANPHFLKDYIGRLGLCLENRLMRFRKGGGSNMADGARSLKGLLMKLSREIEEVRGKTASQSPEEMGKLGRISRFVDESIAAIEAEQILNVLTWEKENKYMVPIPLQLPDGIKRGDILIDADNNRGQAEGKEENVQASLFLSMDALGELVINVGMKSGRVVCRIQCETEELEGFITLRLGDLGQRLQSSGLEVEFLDCTAVENLMLKRQRCLLDKISSVRDQLNLFA